MPLPATNNAGEIAETAQAYVDALLSDKSAGAILTPGLLPAEIEQLRETLLAVAMGQPTIRMTIPVADGDKMLVASDAIKPTVVSDRFKDVLRASPNNALRVVLRLSARDRTWVVTDLDVIPDTAERTPQWASGLVVPHKRLVDEPLLRDLARLASRPDRHAQVFLSDAIQQFNEQQRQRKVGRELPLLTDDEVIAAIRAADFRVVKQELSEAEFQQFQAIAEMRLLPGNWTLEKQTQLASEDGALWSVWIVGLRLNRVDGTETTYAIRDRSLRYDPSDIQHESLTQEAEADWTSLAELVAEFNRKEEPAKHGQPPLTVDESIASMQRFLRQDHFREKQHFPPAVLDVLATMAREKKVPPGTQLDLHQRSSRNTSHLHYWKIVLRCFVGERLFAINIRNRYIDSSPMERIPDDEIAWGPAATDGLQVGVHVVPEKTSPVPGTRYTTTFYFRNLTASSTIAPVSPIGFELDARSATGERLDVTQRQDTLPTPTVDTPTMNVSDRRERWGASFIVTTTKRDDLDTSKLGSFSPSDRASPIAVVHAQPEQPVRLRFRIHDCRVPTGHTHPYVSHLVTGAISLVGGSAATAVEQQSGGSGES